jgi:hypothetical protein
MLAASSIADSREAISAPNSRRSTELGHGALNRTRASPIRCRESFYGLVLTEALAEPPTWKGRWLLARRCFGVTLQLLGRVVELAHGHEELLSLAPAE